MKINAFVFAFLAFLFGMVTAGIITFIVLQSYYNQNPKVVTQTKIEYRTEYKDNEYLKDNACRLYDNYKSLYLNADQLCNSDYSCRGSASQKEAYEAFKSWDSFKEEYCAK
jgi:hypothetical protein